MIFKIQTIHKLKQIYFKEKGIEKWGTSRIDGDIGGEEGVVGYEKGLDEKEEDENQCFC